MMKKILLKQQRDELRNECDELLSDLVDCEKERDELQFKLDNADKAIDELYKMLVPYIVAARLEANDVHS